MLYSALEEISPLEDNFQISKANFVPQVNRMNLAPHALAEHPEAVFDGLIAARATFDG